MFQLINIVRAQILKFLNLAYNLIGQGKNLYKRQMDWEKNEGYIKPTTNKQCDIKKLQLANQNYSNFGKVNTCR
jgi:hypothetical protein